MSGKLIPYVEFSSDYILHTNKSTIHLCIEYCSNIWPGVPAVHLDILDKIPRRVCNVIDSYKASPLESLSR